MIGTLQQVRKGLNMSNKETRNKDYLSVDERLLLLNESLVAILDDIKNYGEIKPINVSDVACCGAVALIIRRQFLDESAAPPANGDKAVLSVGSSKVYPWSEGIKVRACAHCESDKLTLSVEGEPRKYTSKVVCNSCWNQSPGRRGAMSFILEPWNRRASDKVIAELEKINKRLLLALTDLCPFDAKCKACKFNENQGCGCCFECSFGRVENTEKRVEILTATFSDDTKFNDKGELL